MRLDNSDVFGLTKDSIRLLRLIFTVAENNKKFRGQLVCVCTYLYLQHCNARNISDVKYMSLYIASDNNINNNDDNNDNNVSISFSTPCI